MSSTSQQMESSDTCILRLHDVTVNFDKTNGRSILQHTVLKKINLSVREGEFVTIVGPSGCGKSTLLNVIAGMNSSYDGKIDVDKKPISGSPPTDRVVVFQEGALFPWLTVIDNIEFGLKIGKVPKAERMKIVKNLIGVVGLTNFSNAFIHQLSGGMKQRVAIARALALDPKILLMDEPFAALDVQTRKVLHDYVSKIHRETGKTILFVTHNIHEAVTLGDRIIILSPKLANIKREFKVNIPRPRRMDQPLVKEIIQEIFLEKRESCLDNKHNDTLNNNQETEDPLVIFA